MYKAMGKTLRIISFMMNAVLREAFKNFQMGGGC
jgi:hypothetical protein